MIDDWYLYVNRDTLQICKVSPVLEEDLDSHVLQIEKELGLTFINSPHLLYDYVVYYDGVKAHLMDKSKTKNVAVPFYYSPLIINSDESNPDVLITIKNKKIEIKLREEIVAYAMSIYANVNPSKQIIDLYVSARNDPNYLIEIIQINMIELINKGKLKFPFNHDKNKISIFTRKIFNSYGLTE